MWIVLDGISSVEFEGTLFQSQLLHLLSECFPPALGKLIEIQVTSKVSSSVVEENHGGWKGRGTESGVERTQSSFTDRWERMQEEGVHNSVPL